MQFPTVAISAGGAAFTYNAGTGTVTFTGSGIFELTYGVYSLSGSGTFAAVLNGVPIGGTVHTPSHSTVGVTTFILDTVQVMFFAVTTQTLNIRNVSGVVGSLVAQPAGGISAFLLVKQVG